MISVRKTIRRRRVAIYSTKKAKAQYELKLNEKIDGDEIIGFIPDIKFASFRQEVTPMLSIFGANTSGGRKATIIIPPM